MCDGKGKVGGNGHRTHIVVNASLVFPNLLITDTLLPRTLGRVHGTPHVRLCRLFRTLPLRSADVLRRILHGLFLHDPTLATGATAPTWRSGPPFPRTRLHLFFTLSSALQRQHGHQARLSKQVHDFKGTFANCLARITVAGMVST